MTHLCSLLKQIPVLSDFVHFELRQQLGKSSDLQTLSLVSRKLSLCVATCPESYSHSIRFKTYRLFYSARFYCLDLTFNAYLKSISCGNIGSLVSDIKKNPQLLVQEHNNLTVLDCLLIYIRDNMSRWQRSSNPYDMDEKKRAVSILNQLLRHDCFKYDSYDSIKIRITLKINDIPGLLDLVDLYFYVRVI